MTAPTCAICGSDHDLIAYWSVDHPEQRRYVCRPDSWYAEREDGVVVRKAYRPQAVPCFRLAVCWVGHHKIGAVA